MSDDASRSVLDELVASMRPEHRDARPTDGFLAPGDDAAADALLARTITIPVRRRRRRPWRHITFGLIGVSALVGAGVTAAVLVSGSPDDPTLVACAASFESDDRELVAPDPSASFEDVCRVLWTDGTFGTDGPPLLVACVRGEGTVVVAPGAESRCAMLGMELADGDDATTDRILLLTSALSDRFGGRCLDRDEAVTEAQAILSDLELTEWTVDPSGSIQGQCNGPVLDIPHMTVDFSPVRSITE